MQHVAERERRRRLLRGEEDPDAEAEVRATMLRARPFACDVPGCNEAFSQRHTLVIHKRTHKLQGIANATGRALLAAARPGTTSFQQA